MCRSPRQSKALASQCGNAISSVSWGTLFVGAALGYLVATLVNHHHGEGSEEHTSSKIAFLEHGTKESSEPTASESLHHGEEQLHDEEEHKEGEILDATVAVIVFSLIFLTIVFEYMKESIEEVADRAMKPVLEGLFGELTVLGFLSTVTFCIVKLGWFSQLSAFLFGQEEVEELQELFEMVHYMLFFIMCFFVVNVLVLLLGGESTERKWWNFNRACRDEEYMAQSERLLHNPAKSHNTYVNEAPHLKYEMTYCQFLWRQLFPFSTRNSKQHLRSDLALFRGLRHEFVVERDPEPPFAPHGSAANRVAGDFNFGRYLSICLGHELGHMVHLQMPTWLFLAAVTVAFYGIALFIDNHLQTFAWIWVGAGWFCFLLGTGFDYHMVKLLEGMSAVYVSSDNTAMAEDSETSCLLATPPRDPLLPKWTQIDLDSYLETKRPWLARTFLPKKIHTTRQDCLYLMERKGPKLYMILFQIQMVFTAAYTSLLVLTLLPHIFQDECQLHPVEKWFYVVLSLLPIYLLLSKYQTAAANLTMACSIGVHRRPQFIAQVTREEKTSRIIRVMVSMQKLQRAAVSGFAAPEVERIQQLPRRLTTVELDESLSVFNSLDLSGDGEIEIGGLDAVLKRLGAPATQESLKAMIQLLDGNGDGVISHDEFHWFYKAYVVIELDDDGLHQLAKDMFRQMDVDGTGQLSPCEFKDIVDAFNVGFTMEEIGDVIDELDENDDGEISEHEFIKLLETHRVLFERIPFPKLE